jgi:hypothetical protein
VSPADGATGALRDTAVSAEVILPVVGAGVDLHTLTPATVQLTRVSDGAAVDAVRNTSGGGDVIVLQPTAPLDANTLYRFRVTSGVTDTAGNSFDPFTSTFTTGTLSSPPPTVDAAFEHVALPTAEGESYTSLTFGPDGKLYAGTFSGRIVRWSVNSDGTLGAAQTMDALRAGGDRLVLGLAFDPASTASNLVLWVTSNDPAFVGAPDWSGRVTRLSGPSLGTVQDIVTGLPRSSQDHATNSLAFAADGKLLVTQGANTAMGAPDNAWGQRNEHVLAAALLTIDTRAITSPPLDVKTDEGGTYDPFAANAPVRIHSTGERNTFDLVVHSNGHLYLPTNGSAAGGSTPATPATLPASCTRRIDVAINGAWTGPRAPAINGATQPEHDVLIDAHASGYYGHPDPARCEWVLNGGNPTSGVDPFEVTDYPVGTLPDRNWRRADLFDLGIHYSPDGAIEYRSSAFGGSLDHAVLVARYSAGDDIVALLPATNGTIREQVTNIPGLDGFVDPLDIAQRPGASDLYVTELGASRITLLRPAGSSGGSAAIAVNKPRLVVGDDVQDTLASPARSVRVSNPGTADLVISSVSITGTDAAKFALAPAPGLPLRIRPNEAADLGVAYRGTAIEIANASLVLASNASQATTTVPLRGVGFGSEEPSLQRILDAYQVPVNAGDPDPSTSDMPTTGFLGDELHAQSLRRASAGAVTMQVLCRFGPAGPNGIASRFAWLPDASGSTRRTLFTIANDQTSLFDPDVAGPTAFDPGADPFSFVMTAPAQGDRDIYQHDADNTFTNAFPHHVRMYPMRTSSGAIIPDAVLLGFEEITDYGDYNDVVVVVRNVVPS